MLGLETASSAKARLSCAAPLAPSNPSLGIQGWGWKTSAGCSDPFLSSVWLEQGLFWFKANQVLCANDNWFLFHRAWSFENSDARVSFLIFLLCQGFLQEYQVLSWDPAQMSPGALLEAWKAVGLASSPLEVL